MAKDEKKQAGLLDDITNRLGDLYRRTFYTQPDVDRELDNISDKINKSMTTIVNDINNTTGLDSMTKLYQKAFEYQNNTTVVNGFEDLFTADSFSDTMYNNFFNNRSLRLFDAEIDMICKYMPRLEETVGTLTDNVISADHFTKEFIFIKDENISIETDKEEFYNNFKILKDKYNLEYIAQDIVYNTSKYGERFMYIVPYEKAIKKIMDNPDYGRVVTESFTQPLKSDSKKSIDDDKIHFEVEFNMSNTFVEEIKNHKKLIDRYKIAMESAMNYNEANSSYDEATVPKHKSLTPDDKLDASGFYDDTTADGFLSINNKNKNSDYKLDVNGCVFKELNRYKIIPIYIDNMCLGYYYLENDKIFGLEEDFPVSDTTTPMNSLGINKATDLEATKNAAFVNDTILKTIAKRLSDAIDKKFINMNKDLTPEIYTILKYSMTNKDNRFKVTYLPPDDVVHCYYKLDKDTHRGISDLYKSLIPAKLYIGLYITNTIGQMTRSQDRRVYYVKQSGIDTNISQILLNTIKQIKMQNFNIRQLESMKNVLNIIGKFNDYVIPTDASGNAPVQFEVMQGQNIDPQTELMERLEQNAVNATGVPFEIVQARQSMDYAIQATMSSSRFLKMVLTRQTIVNRFLSEIVTKLYRGEFNKPNAVIEVNLPQPMFLNLTNTNQFLANINDLSQAITDSYATDFIDDNDKMAFMANIKAEYMRSYVDLKMIDRVKEATKLQIAATKSDNGEEV